MFKKMFFASALVFALQGYAFAVTDIWKNKLFIDGEIRSFALFDGDIIDRSGTSGSVKNYNEVPTRFLFGAGYRLNENITIFARAAFFTLWGEDGGQPFATDPLINKLNLAEAYAEVKNIFGSVDIKMGRQFYISDEIYFRPVLYTAERLLYASIDGISLTINTKTTEIRLLGGKEAELTYGGIPDTYAYGFQSKTNISSSFGFNLYAYNHHKDKVGNYGLYGFKPFVDYKNISAALKCLRSFNDDNENDQFFHADVKYKYNADSFSLTPKASFITTTGSTLWASLTYARSIIVEHALGAAALLDTEIYNAGTDFSADFIPNTVFSLDGYYYKGRHRAPDKGTELDLKAVCRMFKNLELGIAGGYLFADSEFQEKDTKKFQLWFLYKF